MDDPTDPYDLQRFVDAQDPVVARVKDELRSGRKRSHWMWFVFPQVEGLGRSRMARRYAISSRGEADAYLIRIIVVNYRSSSTPSPTMTGNSLQ